MKKLFLLLAIFYFVVASAQMNVKHNIKPKYRVQCVLNGEETSEYRDSLIQVTVKMDFSLNNIWLELKNVTDHRITLEWENMRISGSHIAFGHDRMFQMHNARQDEVVTAHGIIFKDVYKRYETLVPIVEKKKLKKEGPQKIYLDIPIRAGDKVYDISTTWIVSIIK